MTNLQRQSLLPRLLKIFEDKSVLDIVKSGPTQGVIPTMSIQHVILKENKLCHPICQLVPWIIVNKITWKSSSGQTGWTSSVTLMKQNKSPVGKFPFPYWEGWTILSTRTICRAQKPVQTSLVSSSLIHWPKPNILAFYLHKPNFLLCKKHKGCLLKSLSVCCVPGSSGTCNMKYIPT